jgi:site-specific DNA-methyltransferase (adenine-specific)
MLLQGDCLKALQNLEANSVDSIVTDPPYGLGFMGKQWDSLPPGQEVFEQCLRVLKPGGHLCCFGGSRTYHRMAVAVEDAGFEIRDQIMWVYGSGFPKSYNVAKGIQRWKTEGSASWNGTGDSSQGPLGYSSLQHEQG